MKLTLTTNDGTVIDSITISAGEYRREIRQPGLLNLLMVSAEDLNDTEEEE